MNIISGKTYGFDFPSKASVIEFTQNMAAYLFPIIEGGGCKPESDRKMREDLIRLLAPLKKRLSVKPEIISDNFFAELPLIKIKLEKDANFISANDPAASGIDEVILAYPGFFAILVFRLAHFIAASCRTKPRRRPPRRRPKPSSPCWPG